MAAPSKYKDEFPAMLVDHLAKGYSLDSFAAKVGVSYNTLNEWCKDKTELNEAKKEGQAKSLLWWEDQGHEGLWEITDFFDKDGNIIRTTKKLNTTVWIFSMKNRHGWRDQAVVPDTDDPNFDTPEFLSNDKKPEAD